MSRYLKQVPMDTILHYVYYDKRVGAAICLVIAIVAWFGYLRFEEWYDERAASFTLQPPEQCLPGWEGKVLSEPSITIPQSTAIQCYCPASGRLLGQVNPTTADGIERIIAKATSAQEEWKHTTFGQRRKVLRTLLKFVQNNQEDIVRAACLDSGKTRVDALFGEVLVTVSKLKWTIEHGERVLKPSPRPTNLLMAYKKNEVRYEPLGVVAACVSWNYPFHNLIGPVISAIFAGNTIVVKCSEQTAWSSAYFVKIIKRAIETCGFSPDIVSTIVCFGETANYLTSHESIQHITFIGSRPVAHHVAKSASKSLTPLCLELGGKDAAIVLDDPQKNLLYMDELKRVASIIMRGVFQSAGQNCVGIERVIAMLGSYKGLIKLLEPRIKALRLGDDLDPNGPEDGAVDVGAMISSSSFDRLEDTISEAETQGARVLVGGRRYSHPRYPNGHYFEPTLIVDVTPEMRIAKEELFGPVCVLMFAEDADDALRIANASNYSLGASVFSPTWSALAKRQINYVINNVKAGMVSVNDFAAYYVVQLPFGGRGGSGYGRFAGKEGLRSLCNPKSVCSDRYPFFMKTSIPSKLDYPMEGNARFAAEAVIDVGFGNVLRKLKGVFRLVW